MFRLSVWSQWILTSLVFSCLTLHSGTSLAVQTDETNGQIDYLDLELTRPDDDTFPWQVPEDDHQSVTGEFTLSRRRRDADNSTSGDKSVWDKIEEFYSDKNNMAMYCVLPIIVLVYGGCSAIYCVHKCRQYLRRRKHKRLKEEDCDSLNSDKNDVTEGGKAAAAVVQERPISQISQAWVDINMDPKGKWSGQAPVQPDSGQSPLPWQIPEKTEVIYNQKATSRSAELLDDALKEEDIHVENGRRSQSSLNPKAGGGVRVLEDSLDKNQNKTALFAASSTTSLQGTTKQTDGHEMKQFGAVKEKFRPPVVKALEPMPFEDTRVHANLEDYSTNKSTAVKATDYSRFSDARPIEIIPLSADPHLRLILDVLMKETAGSSPVCSVAPPCLLTKEPEEEAFTRGWDPLHNRPFGDQGLKFTPVGAEGGASESGSRSGSHNIKEEMLARYDALSAFQMAKKAAEILKVNAVEKTPFERKPAKKKHIFIAE